jgi:selenocysteine-specific elongation factor
MQVKNRRTLILATAGHVDHGKTSLIKLLTGVETDTLAEEKARGLTIVPGFAYLESDNSDFVLGFVDVPGHQSFISNMISGIGSVEGCVIAIAADDGIMPQTREHIEILDLLNIKLAVVVITKVDRVDPARIKEVTDQTDDLLRTTRLKNSGTFRVSSVTKQGIGELRLHLNSLFEENNQKLVSNIERKNTRFLVDRSFVIKGLGTVVTGSVISGIIKTNDNLALSNSDKMIKIRGIRLDSIDISQAHINQRAALLVNVHHTDIKRGDYLFAVENKNLQHLDRFDASLKMSKSNTLSIDANHQYHLYLGASHRVARVRHLGTDLYQISYDEPLSIHHGDRLILRDPSATKTVAGGCVIDISVPRRNRASSERLKVLEINRLDDAGALIGLINEEPSGLHVRKFIENRNLTLLGFENLVREALTPSKPFTTIEDKNLGKFLLDRKKYDDYKTWVKEHIAQHHKENPSDKGLKITSLLTQFPIKFTENFWSNLISKIANEGSIQIANGLIKLTGHETIRNPVLLKFDRTIKPLLLRSPKIPPRTREVAEALQMSLSTLESIMKECEKEKELIKVAKNRHYLPNALSEIAESAIGLASRNQETGFSVVQFRDHTGIGRNLCVEILEYFDRIGFTKRNENQRAILNPEKIRFKTEHT